MAREMKDSGIEWMGEIPKSYSVCRLKHLLKKAMDYGANSSGVEYSDHLPRYIRITDIAADGKLKNEGALSLELKDACPYILEEGDILFARSGATIGKSFIYHKEYGNAAFAGYLIRAQLKEKIAPQYIYYYTCSAGYDIWKNGIFIQSTIQNISADKYANLPIVLPEAKGEQMRIASFLEYTCTEIDNVLEKTRISIEEYKKLKQAVITQAVTKGIRDDREVKDSGIEWIGEIPKEWEVNTVFQLFVPVKNKNIDLKEKNLLSLSYGKIKQKPIETVIGLLPENFEGYNIVEKEDIVLRLTDLQNDHKSLRVGFVTERGIITAAYCTIRSKSVNISKYLYYYLHSFDVAKGFYGMGAGVRQGLNWDGLKKLKIIIPPLEEQQEIVNYLDEKCSAIDELIAKKEQYLAEIENYKKSLIYEYVTGKKEVPQEYQV